MRIVILRYSLSCIAYFVCQGSEAARKNSMRDFIHVKREREMQRTLSVPQGLCSEGFYHEKNGALTLQYGASVSESSLGSLLSNKIWWNQRKQINSRGRIGNSLAVQWLGLHVLTAKGLGSVPGQGTRIPQAKWCSPKQNKQKKGQK